MSQEIPQFDLSVQMQRLGPELAEATDRVFRSGWFVLGPEVEAFEAEFAEYCGVAHAVGVASGTDALELALRAAGIGPGDEVITVAHTFVATPLAIMAVGARPVFIDVRPGDGLMDPALVADALTDRTRAIIPVHLYGRCVDMAPILELARARSLTVIEDAAQAHGASSDGRKAGSIGDLGCFSFYPTKNLGALGDGGTVTTDNDALAASLRLLRNYGQTAKYHHDHLGRNSRLDELQAALLRVKLRHLDELNTARRRVAARYLQAIGGGASQSMLMLDSDLDRDVVHQAVARVGDRDGLRRFLSAQGIATRVHYPIPCHRQRLARRRTCRSFRSPTRSPTRYSACRSIRS